MTEDNERTGAAALLLGLFLLLAPGLAHAQTTGTINGRVTEAFTGDTIPGANVLVEGAGVGAATDIDGKFEIVGVPTGHHTIVVSFVGFKRFRSTVEVDERGSLFVDARLEEDLLGMEEVIVTGQGAGVETRRLSTTVEVITARKIEQTPATRLEELLQAQLPGAQIRLTSGQPGTASMIRSRGVLSAMSATTPVIYVDGIRVDNLNTASALNVDTGGAESSALPDIPLENIERIEYIKGGAATTLFGSDAANGVIQIFTKKGLAGTPSLSYETTVGGMAGTTDYLFFDRTADALFKTGLVQQHRLSGSGGTSDLTYSFSGMMYEDNGFRLGNETVRYGFRTGVAGQISPTGRYSGSMAFSSNSYTRDFNANDGWGLYGSLENGTFGNIDELSDEEFDTVVDYVAEASGLTDISADVKRFQSAHSIELVPVKNLVTTFTAGMDYRFSQEQSIVSPAFLDAVGSAKQSAINRAERRYLGLTLEGTGRHTIDHGDFSFVTTFGGQVFRNQDHQLLLTARDIAEGSSSINNSATQGAEDFELLVANYGVYVVENVGFRNRLFLEGGLRIDGNSAFGDEIGAVAYPKVGLAYSASSEPFLQRHLGLGGSLVSNLKLRANLGYAGNFPMPFANIREVDTFPYLGRTAVTFGAYGNENMRPEKVRTWEVGSDVAFLNDRVALEVTYYNALTEDALFDVRFPVTSGRFEQLANVGQVLNRGWEIKSMIFPINTSTWDVRLGASLNTLHNEVLDMGTSAPFTVGGFTFLGQWVMEGESVGFLRGARPVYDADGNVLKIKRNVALGSPLPDAYGNLSMGITFRDRLRLLAVADYQWGAYGVAVDDVLRFFSGLQDPDRFPVNADGETPALGQASFVDLAGAWAEKTDYLKVRLISLNYHLPEKWYLTGKVRRIDVGFRVVNPFGAASSSFDPEVTGINSVAQGGLNVGVFGFGTESPPRQYLVNLKVGF